MRDFLTKLMVERRAQPTDDLLSHITHASINGVPLTDREIIGMTVFLYVAGNETTSMLLGNALWLLDQYPGERARLRADPSSIPAAIEEVLRYEAPVTHQARMTTRPVEIAGHTIPEGKKVLLMYASANRDAAAFPDADRFDPQRESARHLSFGEGIHFCRALRSCASRRASPSRRCCVASPATASSGPSSGAWHRCSAGRFGSRSSSDPDGQQRRDLTSIAIIGPGPATAIAYRLRARTTDAPPGRWRADLVLGAT